LNIYIYIYIILFYLIILFLLFYFLFFIFYILKKSYLSGQNWVLTAANQTYLIHPATRE